MTIQVNTCVLQRSPNGSAWTTLDTITTTSAGVTGNTFFDQPGAGFWYYRIAVVDNNGNLVGRTTLLAVVLSR